MRPGRVSEAERLRRWRLVLGGGEADGTGGELAGDDLRIDAAMAAVYDQTTSNTVARARVGAVGWSGPERAPGGPMAG